MTFGQAIRGHELEIRIRKQVFYSKKYLRVVVLPEELIAETCWYFIRGFLYKQQVPLDTFLNTGGLIFFFWKMLLSRCLNFTGLCRGVSCLPLLWKESIYHTLKYDLKRFG